MNEYYEIQNEQEMIKRAEKETFQELNGFSDEENEFISCKYDENVHLIKQHYDQTEQQTQTEQEE